MKEATGRKIVGKAAALAVAVALLASVAVSGVAAGIGGGVEQNLPQTVQDEAVDHRGPDVVRPHPRGLPRRAAPARA